MRNIHIDVAKGIAIFLVVLGHVLMKRGENNVFPLQFIYSFHMPLFFIISGMFINTHRSLKEVVINKGIALLYPYCIFSVIAILYIITKYMFGIVEKNDVIDIILVSVSFQGYGVLWFLPTLYMGILFFHLIYKCRYNKLIFLGLFFVCLYLYSLPMFICSNILYSYIYRVMVTTLFLYIGYFAAEKGILMKNGKLASLGALLLILFNSFLIRTNGLVDYHLTIFNNMFLFMCFAISTSLSIIVLCNRCNNRLLSYWGANSLIIMLTHYVFPILSFGLWIGNFVINPYISVIIIMLIIMIIETFVCRLLNLRCLWLVKYKMK